MTQVRCFIHGQQTGPTGLVRQTDLKNLQMFDEKCGINFEHSIFDRE